MGDWRIRIARRGDGLGLAALHSSVALDYVELDPSRFREPDEEGLAEWLEGDLVTMGDSWVCFVAEQGGQIVGEVEARLLPPMESARYQVLSELSHARGEVNSLGVIKSHRRRGIGRALMQHAERWLIERGARVIRLDTFAASPDSVPFYEEIGYESCSIVFERRI